MLRTILFLITTLIALPIVSWYADEPLRPEQWDVLRTLGWIMLGVALTCFVVSERTGNYSQVDKLWSIIPILYVWVAVYAADFAPRLTLMAVLATLWGARLTFNFARRGGYQWPPWAGEEDYRWSILRQTPLLQNPRAFRLFNLFFISLYQNTLILLFTLPIVAAWQGDGELQIADWLLAAVFVGLLGIETVADQQQYDFQTEKYRRIAAGEPLDGMYAQGFVSTGLWARMRHPNYAAEQAIWICFYCFSIVATGSRLNWSLTGAILLVLLFLGSSDFSEKISAGKYPAYQDYQRKVPRFLPKIFPLT
jgi:steroid 5-alpha reductase family enzyme